MAITLVAGQNITASGTGGTVTAAHFNNTIAAGNAIVVAVVTNNVSFGAAVVSDNNGNTFVKQGTSYQASGMTVEMWMAKNVTSTGAPTQTISVSAFNGGDVVALIAQEVSGLQTFDKQANVSAASSMSATTGSVTTTQATEILLGVGSQTGGTRPFTAGSGYTMITTNTSSSSAGIALEYRIVTVTGTYNATMTVDLPTTLGLGLWTISDVAAAVTTPKGRMTMLGIG